MLTRNLVFGRAPGLVARVVERAGPLPDTLTTKMTLALLGALLVSKYLHKEYVSVWMALVIVLAFALMRVRHSAAAKPAVRLLQSLGILSALYGLLHYPLMPVLDTSYASISYAILLFVWVLSCGCGVACLRWGSLALIPAAFLTWSASFARQVTGLRHGQTLDVVPLAEVSICLGLGLAILHLHQTRTRHQPRLTGEPDVAPVEFARIALMIGIAIHLANYFWSAVAKATLTPLLSWVWFNNPVNIYLAATDDGHITFSDYALASRTVAQFLDSTHLVSNVLVLGAQAVAVLGFVMPKRWLIVLLLGFDMMHLGIAIAAGANFWPWVLLNVAIAAAVVRKEYVQPRLAVGLLLAIAIVIAPKFANVALLGWFDSAANNNMYFQAEDDRGRRYYVAPNFFTFYSFPIGHMVYGVPDPETAFAVGDPNGGTRRYKIAKAGQACDVATLIQPGTKKPPYKALDQFIVNHHKMAQRLENRIGLFPFNYYPHHFFVRPSLSAAFEALDKDRVRAYIYRRESVCLSLVDGQVRRRVISTGEHRIEIPRGKIVGSR